MLLALEFTDTIDPATVATFVLAAVAIVGLVLTRRSLKQTQDEIDLSRREVEEAHRPVVVPTPAARPVVPTTGSLTVPVANVGMGPALAIEATATLLDSEGNPSAASSGEQTSALIAGLAAGDTTILEIRRSRWTTGVSFELTVVYGDVAGKRWRTVGRCVNDRERYEGVTVGRA